MAEDLNKIVNNEHVNFSELFRMLDEGLIMKITYSQYVITEKAALLIENN